MTSVGGAVERRIQFDGDALAATAGLCAESADQHVLYEHGGAIRWAEGRQAEVQVRATGATLVRGARRTEFPLRTHPLAAAGDALRSLGGAEAPGGPRACGWVSFELSQAHRDAVAAEDVLAWFLVPEREVVVDGGTALLRAADAAELDRLERRLRAATAAEPVSADADLLEHGAEEYRAGVRDAVAEIRAGRLDKVILSRPVPVPGEIDLAATYLAGRRANTPARSFLLRLGGWEAAGYSPEIVAKVGPGRVVTTQPLAGTRALAGDSEVDGALRAELYRDAKEVYEHAISVRLAAQELDGVCAPGSVRVAEFMHVEERGSVQHLASELSGVLRADADAWDALAALFPAVTASGIPKEPAGALIRRLEREERGLYSGAVVAVDGDELDAALVLRSVYRKDGRTWLRAGAGVVADSDPDRELEETREKLRSVCRHLVPAAEPAVTP